MKQAIAKLKHAHIAPRKMRLVAGLVRGLPTEEAEAQLSVSPKRAAPALLKVIRSAVANAKQNYQMNTAKLKIEEIRVDEGPMMKRWTPRSRGSVAMIQKKTSHVTVAVSEDESVRQPGYVFGVKAEPKKKGKEKEEKNRRKEERVEKSAASAPQAAEAKQKFFRRKSV